MNPTTLFVLDTFKKSKKELITIIAVATIGAILTVIIPYVYGRIFDLAIVPATGINLLLSLVGLWFLLSLIATYISHMTGYMGEVLGATVAMEAESDAYSHFLTLPILFH